MKGYKEFESLKTKTTSTSTMLKLNTPLTSQVDTLEPIMHTSVITSPPSQTYAHPRPSYQSANLLNKRIQHRHLCRWLVFNFPPEHSDKNSKIWRGIPYSCNIIPTSPKLSGAMTIRKNDYSPATKTQHCWWFYSLYSIGHYMYFSHHQELQPIYPHQPSFHQSINPYQ